MFDPIAPLKKKIEKFSSSLQTFAMGFFCFDLAVLLASKGF